ncbi:nuclear transport factor 2 family protein [Candidatus Cyanaurora vandensis]|uniref:nuclear transport factor 2 family protein n=1 Tax=Candidatus Cyanaurora vandensis TaxID=2714958 RepID=UPI0025808142|nr:nuclear transport factor 2 family protein [Candidatus Cyanaurora vandensis]
MKQWWFGCLWLALPVAAQSDLNQVIREFDQSASRRDLSAVMSYYAPDFKNNDGLDKAKLTTALTNFWKDLPESTYTTEVLDLKVTGDQTTATTRTRVTGQLQQNNFTFALLATTEAQSLWQQQGGRWQLLSQTITSEKSELKSGPKPPQVKVELPATVAAGKSYELSAILAQPLEEKVILGTVLQGNAGQDLPLINLDDLRAGGLFKKNSVPAAAIDQVVNLGFVQGDGMYFLSQRIKVE